mgnify:CR=1 FL=1
MNSFRSSPLITGTVRPKFGKKGKRVSRRRESREGELQIPNPFKVGEQENYLPLDLKKQI